MKTSRLLIIGLIFILVLGITSLKPAEAKPHVPHPYEAYSRTMKVIDCAIYDPAKTGTESIRCDPTYSTGNIFTQANAIAWIKYQNYGIGPNTVTACFSINGAKVLPAACQTHIDGINVNNGEFDWKIIFKSKGQHKASFTIAGPNNYKNSISFLVSSK